MIRRDSAVCSMSIHPGNYIIWIGYGKLFVLQTFLALISQVFPAEDDVNKLVDDNCKSTHSWLLIYFLQPSFKNVVILNKVCIPRNNILSLYLSPVVFRFPYVLE